MDTEKEITQSLEMRLKYVGNSRDITQLNKLRLFKSYNPTTHRNEYIDTIREYDNLNIVVEQETAIKENTIDAIIDAKIESLKNGNKVNLGDF